ncbi:hypothetical protein T492DRAFT_1051762 [Pavlovales sp. CCMP2436]|nr:hypothetical protein T492DRAFT_1051762 [Pavlovales sp. CCMP2436]
MGTRQRWGKKNFRSKLELLLDCPNGRIRPVLPLPLSTWGEPSTRRTSISHSLQANVHKPSTRRTSIAHSLQANVHKKQAMEAAMPSIARELDTCRTKFSGVAPRYEAPPQGGSGRDLQDCGARGCRAPGGGDINVSESCTSADEVAKEAAREAATRKAEVAADARQARINSAVVAWAAVAARRAAAAAWRRCLVYRNERDAGEACRAEASFVCAECFPAFEANITIKTSIRQRSIW